MVAASVWTGSDGCGASEKSCASPDGDRNGESGEGGARLRYEVAQANDSRAQAPAARHVTTLPPRPPQFGFARRRARFDRREAPTTSPGAAPPAHFRRRAGWRALGMAEWA